MSHTGNGRTAHGQPEQHTLEGLPVGFALAASAVPDAYPTTR